MAFPVHIHWYAPIGKSYATLKELKLCLRKPVIREFDDMGPTRENMTLLYGNNKVADQTAHLRGLICAFVVH